MICSKQALILVMVRKNTSSKASKPKLIPCTQDSPLWNQFRDAVRSCLLKPDRKSKLVGHKFFIQHYPDLAAKFEERSLRNQLYNTSKKVIKELKENGYVFDENGNISSSGQQEEQTGQPPSEYAVE